MIVPPPVAGHDDPPRPPQGGARRSQSDPGRPPRHPLARGPHPPSSRARRLGLPEPLGQAHAWARRGGAVGLWLGLVLALATPPLRAAEPPPSAAGPSDGAVTVGQVIVNGERRPACPQVAGGHDLNLACLNRELQAAARAGSPPPAVLDAAARDAQTPSKAGTFSQSATAERLGKNFGHSATPYRPPTPVYSNPILPAGAPR